MFDFLKKRSYRVLKVFKLVNKHNIREIDFKSVIELVEDNYSTIHSETADYFTLNFKSKPYKRKKFYETLETGDASKVVRVFGALNQSSETYFTYINSFANSTNEDLEGVMQITCVIDSKAWSTSEIVQFSTRLYSSFKFDYGYSITLTKDYDVNTEVMKTDLRNYSRESYTWEEYMKAMLAGFIRNVYELNLLNPSHIKQLKSALTLGKCLNVNSAITAWTLTEGEIKEAKKLIPKRLLLSNREEFMSNPFVNDYYLPLK